MTNREIAGLLRRVAAVYQVRGENRFRIIAYENAADSIEHLTTEAKDLWDDGKLKDVPGIGSTIAGHLDELFSKGRVRHWEEEFARVPEAMFPLLLVPGIGPKRAYFFVKELRLGNPKTVISDLERAARENRIAPLEGYGDKSQAAILDAIASYRKGQIKENRMTLPYADTLAQEVIRYMKQGRHVQRIDALGSLRRQVSTIGDIDLAVATESPKDVIDRFLAFPHERIVDRGESGATITLVNGRQVDLRVQKPAGYGAMLQYFTGSKNHNIRLREYALRKGLSLSEHGIKHTKTGKLTIYDKEESFYNAVGIPYIVPELREDKGEIEAALRTAGGQPGGLPDLVEINDIKGDLHVHSNYNLESSHDLGKSTIHELLDKARFLGYEYVGFSDHNPSIAKHTKQQVVDIMKRRQEAYQRSHDTWEKKSHEKIGMFVMCEVDILPDGKLALPLEAMAYVDAVIVSVHSAFTQDRKTVTKRLLAALNTHPNVRILGHPTGRLLGSREGIDADWDAVFDEAKKLDIALEINAYPDRLDLPDMMVFDAVKHGVRFTIDTDSHAGEQMDLMQYGVSVARRGWAQKHDILNTLGYTQFRKWLAK